MTIRKLSLPIGNNEQVSAVLSLPAEDRGPRRTVGLITAHGAGNDMNNPLLVAFSEGRAIRLCVSTFPIRKKSSRHRTGRKNWRALGPPPASYFQEDTGITINRTIAAGKSMGGRIASQMAADGTLAVDGLIFLGSPLHRGWRLRKNCGRAISIKSAFPCFSSSGPGTPCTTFPSSSRSWTG